MRTDLPIVKIGKITLREICEADYLDYYYIGCDSETCKFLNWGPFNNPSESLYILRDVILKRPLDNIPVGYAIVYKKKMIGVIDFHTYNEKQNSIEVGYILHRDYQNKGIMKKCLKEVINIAFNHLEVDKLNCGTTINNIASQKVILSCGFKYEKQVLAKMKNGDELADYYSIYKSEYYGG